MSTDKVNERHWIVAVIFPKQLKGMNKNQSKLADLEKREECFPPKEISSRPRNDCNENEVCVDDDVNCCVDEAKECRVSTRQKFHSPPNGNWHYAVMSHMIKVYQIETFQQNVGYGFKEVCELA